MPSKDPLKRLHDILECIHLLREWTKGMNLAAFQNDRLRSFACTRALSIISEASKRLPAQMKARMPGIDWPGMAAAGNIYRHEYESVSDRLVWAVIEQSLDPLEAAVVAELARHED